MSFSEELILILLGAIITFILTIIYRIIESKLNNMGKVKIYRKIVYNKVDGTSWGINRSETQTKLIVPMWIEIHNPKKRQIIIRDFSLTLYNKGKPSCKMKQINEIGNKKEYFGNKGAYSFIIGPESIEKFDLFYAIIKDSNNIDFDQIKVEYFLKNDKKVIKNLLKVDEGWNTNDTKADENWILIK